MALDALIVLASGRRARKWVQRYFGMYLWTVIAARVLLVRCDPSPQQRRILRRFAMAAALRPR